jgi:hypothetical protein
MKTIEKGRPQKGWSKELRCTGAGNGGGGCGALLLVEKPDIYQNEITIYNTFTCKECGVETDIHDNLPFIPPGKTAWSRRRGKEVEELYEASKAFLDSPGPSKMLMCSHGIHRGDYCSECKGVIGEEQ